MTTLASFILASSSLVSATVAEHLKHQRTVGGVSEVVYIEQISATVDTDEIVSSVDEGGINAVLEDGTISSTITILDAKTLLQDNTIKVETA